MDSMFAMNDLSAFTSPDAFHRRLPAHGLRTVPIMPIDAYGGHADYIRNGVYDHSLLHSHASMPSLTHNFLGYPDRSVQLQHLYQLQPLMPPPSAQPFAVPRANPASQSISGSSSDTSLSTMPSRTIVPSSINSSPAPSRPHSTAVFSRRTDGMSGSPPRVTNTEGLLFCRTQNPNGRQRTAQACEKCRDRKTKCSGNRPVCKRCSDRGLTCVWAPETRVRGPQRQHKQRKLDAEDSAGEAESPLALPTSDSQPSSPAAASPMAVSTKVPIMRPLRSAPPLEASFPPFDKPGKFIDKPDPKRSSWPADPTVATAIATAIQKGSDATKVLGEPIQPISPNDDGWDTIHDAPLDSPRERSDTITPATFGLRPGVKPDLALPLIDQNGNLAQLTRNASGDTSPPTASSRTVSTGKSDSDFNAIFTVPDLAQFVQQDLDMYDQGMHILPTGAEGTHMNDDEMMKLLNFSLTDPASLNSSPASALGLIDSTHEFAKAANVNVGSISDDITPLALNPRPGQHEDDFMSQYFNHDMFESNP